MPENSLTLLSHICAMEQINTYDTIKRYFIKNIRVGNTWDGNSTLQKKICGDAVVVHGLTGIQLETKHDARCRADGLNMLRQPRKNVVASQYI